VALGRRGRRPLTGAAVGSQTGDIAFADSGRVWQTGLKGNTQAARCVARPADAARAYNRCLCHSPLTPTCSSPHWSATSRNSNRSIPAWPTCASDWAVRRLLLPWLPRRPSASRALPRAGA
jgi:hypothetical protein